MSMAQANAASRDAVTRAPVVLVVDDDRDMLHVIKSLLEDEGLSVLAAADGGRALEMAGEGQPDLAILDYTLPVLGGRQVAARLHEDRGASFPVLAITADGNAAAKARELGAYAYLRKPFDLADLLREVWNGLRPQTGGLAEGARP